MPPVIVLPKQQKREQLSQALLLQGYCLSVLAQQPLKLDALGAVQNANEIKSIATKLDSVLRVAQGHARAYLDVLQPRLITETVELRAWIQRAEVFPESIRTDARDWHKGLDVLVGQTAAHRAEVLGNKGALERLRDDFQHDSEEFKELASRLDTLVTGERGALEHLSQEIGALQTKINGLIAATTLGFLAAAIGVLMMIVGAVASPFTAGGTAALIIGGFALTAVGGVGGGVSAAVLKESYAQMRQKLEDQRRLNGAVKILEASRTALTTISGSASSAARASQEMANAWTTLGASLNRFKDDLTDQALPSMRDWWVNTLKADLVALKQDLQRNLDQMDGVKVEHTGNTFLFEHSALIQAA